MTSFQDNTLYLGASPEQRHMEDGRWRLISLSFVFILCYACLAIRLFGASMGEKGIGEYFAEAWQRIGSAPDVTMSSMRAMQGEVDMEEQPRWQPAVPKVVMPRQSIRDANGVLLASSVPTRSLYARPQEIMNPEAVAAKLVQLIPTLNTALTTRRLHSSAKFVWLERHLTPEEQEAILWAGIPGVYLHDDYRRIYPHGRLMSHVLGYTDVDGHGLAGVEKYFDEQLTRDDEMKPLELSVDVRLQQVLYDAVAHAMTEYRAIAAAGAVFHIPTAQARAMVSLPDYDPNRPRASHSDAHFNRLSVGQYELGSVFKALSTALALEHGNLSMTDGFDATHPIKFQGNTIRDFHAKKRWLSVPEIMVYSSNIGTVKMVASVGMEKQRAFLNQLGLFDTVGLELHERSVPVTRRDWKPVEGATISYGHGINVTPMHFIRSMMAVNHGGVFRDVTLVKGAKKEGKQLISKQTSLKVNRLMRAVVQHGTASKVDVEGYAVGAKTGTANKVVDGRYSVEKKLSSLVAAFPMPEPEYFIFIMLDEPKGTKDTFNFATAGWVAAPTAANVIRGMTPIIGMPAEYITPEDEIDHIIIEAADRAKRAKTHAYVHTTSY